MARVFSRAEFYQLVWSKPMTHLAKEFALSDVALHKICRKHDIPNPPLGWWAKKAAGKPARQTRLPKLKKGISERITIAAGNLSREADPLAAVREQARINASSASDESPAEAAVVRATIAKLRKAQPAPTGLVATSGGGLINCLVAPASIERVELSLNRIVAAAHLQGFSIYRGDGPAQFSGCGEFVGFSISERLERIKHELTTEELARQAQSRLRRQKLKNEWDDLLFEWPRFPEWDFRPTGQLIFAFDSGEGGRRSFRDAKTQRVEKMATDIAVGLAVLAAAKTAERKRREELARWQDEQRRQREVVLRAKHVDDRRAAVLTDILNQVAQLDRLERLLGGMGSIGPDKVTDSNDSGRVDEFVRWANSYLEQQRAATSREALEARFQDQRIFGPDDDRDFYPPRW